jgi:hypothetical protein
MKTTRSLERRPIAVVRTLLLGAATVLAWRGALALDTGHHVEVTESVLREHGFGATAIQVVQVSNWLTDYYSVRPMSRENLKTGLSKLHFDNLYTTEDVARYWGWLMHNAREATRETAEVGDPAATLTLLGVLSHAVQDFYAHSNWVNAHRKEPGGPYRVETWIADGAPEGIHLFTGSYPPYPSPPPPAHPEHGDYDSGLNKDSHVRPMWAEAYVSAYCATHEVVAALRQWVEEARPGFWAEVKGYRVDDVDQRRLDLDIKAMREISMWVKGKGAEGHWKGGGSGSARYLSGVAVEWTSSPASVVVRQVKKNHIQERLAAELYSSQAPPPLPPMAAFGGNLTVVEVGITYVAEKRGFGRRIDRGRKADLYAVTTVGGQRYVDRVLRGKKRYSDPWVTIHVAAIGQSEIPVRLEVWDQDETLGRKDDLCDINPEAGRKELEFTVRVPDDRLTGDVEGFYGSPERPFEIAGAAPDELGVLIRGYVRTRKLAGR